MSQNLVALAKPHEMTDIYVFSKTFFYKLGNRLESISISSLYVSSASHYYRLKHFSFMSFLTKIYQKIGYQNFLFRKNKTYKSFRCYP